MPPSQSIHDPFNDAPIRASTAATTSFSSSSGAATTSVLGAHASLRPQPSQQSLRPHPAAPSRPRAQANLFAPSRSRRPAARPRPRTTTTRAQDHVLEDSDSREGGGDGAGAGFLAEDEEGAEQEEHGAAEEVLAPTAQQRPRRQIQRLRHASPDARQTRAGLKPTKPGKSQAEEEETEFVKRHTDGSFLLDDYADVARGHLESQELYDEAKLKALDEQYAVTARQYLTSAVSTSGRGSKKFEEEDYEELRMPMAMRLRELVLQKLKDDQWKYESTQGITYGL